MDCKFAFLANLKKGCLGLEPDVKSISPNGYIILTGLLNNASFLVL